MEKQFRMYFNIDFVACVIAFVACVIVNSKRALPPGDLSGIWNFVLEKLQMHHGGAERSYKNPTVGFENETKRREKRTKVKRPTQISLSR